MSKKQPLLHCTCAAFENLQTLTLNIALLLYRVKKRRMNTAKYHQTSTVEIMRGSSICKESETPGCYLSIKAAPVRKADTHLCSSSLTLSSDASTLLKSNGTDLKVLKTNRTLLTKAKWLNDYSQLQPNLPSSKNVALLFTRNGKCLKENRQKLICTK